MGKKYLMFVDERGILSKNANDNITMMGIIFEYNYCTDLEDKECELKTKLNKFKKRIFSEHICNEPLDSIILCENVYKGIHMTEIKKFIGGLPSLIRNLNFTVISCTVKQDLNKIEETYSIVTKKLLKKFYSFLASKNGETGGIIVEAIQDKVRCLMQQKLFNIYSEMNEDLILFNETENRINTFIVCEKNNKTYGIAFELTNILNNIFYRVLNGYREIDRKLISYSEYGNKDKILDAVKCKVFNDVEVGIPNAQFQMLSYINVEMFSRELRRLKSQMLIKDVNINEKEKEIEELSNEINMLNKRLEEVLCNGQSNNIIAKIFSDIDSKMKNFDNSKVVTTVSKS
jgi:hypothetical protein